MTSYLTTIATGLMAAAFSATLYSSAPAMGTGGSGTTPPTPITKKCKKGMVWDKKKKKCLKIKSGLMDDNSLYEVGRDLAYWERYDEAITVLSFIQNKNDPRVLNFLGFSHRKMGRVQVGLGYYRKALRIDPDYTLVREYMGEAFLQIGDLASAKEQLREIELRCGKGCSEYAMLSKQIADYKLN